MLVKVRLINTSLEEIWVGEYILRTDHMLAVEFLIWHRAFETTHVCFSKEQTYQDMILEKAIYIFLFHKPASVINPGVGARTREVSGAAVHILSVSHIKSWECSVSTAK